MELAARKFARRVLLVHLMILAIILAAVIIAARGVYVRARNEAIAQAQKREELLASQTARGIENYYASIFSNLDLIKRGGQQFPRNRAATPERPAGQQPSPRPGPARPNAAPRPNFKPEQRVISGVATLLWHQLEGRVSNLIAVDRASNEAFESFPKEEVEQAQTAVSQAKPWIQSVKDAPSVSGLMKVDGEWAHLLGVHEAAPGVLLVAVVPIEKVEERFLHKVNQDQSVRATLVDDSGLVIAAASQLTIGEDLTAQDMDPVLRSIFQGFLASSTQQTQVVSSITHFKDREIRPRMLTAEPVAVGGRKWLLIISSPLADVEGMVQRIFNYALWWSILVVTAMTGTLVSTSVWMIRSRLRIERLRNQLMKKEMAEARKIQLAWLPATRIAAGEIDIAAVNEPASHISGDFYDWFELPDGRTAVTIGDVTGHGMSAAFLMSTTQLLIRNTLLRTADPGLCLEEVNRQLCSQKFNGQFVTVLILVLDITSNTLEVATAGHYPPLLTDGETVQPLDMDSQLVLGVEEREKYPTERFDLPERFTLLLYTDGVLDARSPRGERFTTTRLKSAIPADTASAQEMVDAIASAVKSFSGQRDLSDDLTLVAIQGQPIQEPQPAAA
jgi:serine phosphatase RsbU (regulator of sigma subunit)/type II secretory pathway pseudopilin PulG